MRTGAPQVGFYKTFALDSPIFRVNETEITSLWRSALEIIDLWIRVLTKPAETFQKEKANASIGEAQKHLAIGFAITGAALGLFLIATGRINPGPDLGGPIFGSIITAIFYGLICSLLGAWGGLVNVGFFFTIAKGLGGKGDFKTQFYLYAIFASPMMVIGTVGVGLFALLAGPLAAAGFGVPALVIGAIILLLGFLYFLYLSTLSIKEAHSLNTLNAVGVWFLPLVLGIILVLCLILLPGLSGMFLPAPHVAPQVTPGNQNPNSDLLDAVSRNDTVIVKLLLEKGADINTKFDGGSTPLHLAASNGYTEIVKLLIDNGADVNAQNDLGNTPLHLAADNGYTEIVKYLIEKGADVNVKSDTDWTPLNAAAESGSTEIVKLLLEKGADINAKDWLGCTPLHGAVRKGYTEIAKYLIDHGADVNAKDNFGETPLDYALNYESTKNNSELINMLKAAMNKS